MATRIPQICDRCGEKNCFNPEDAYGEFCEDCEQNRAEAAYERQQESDAAPSFREQYVAAWHEHQKAHRR